MSEPTLGDHRDFAALIDLLAGMEIPDSFRIGFFSIGGLRAHVADMIVQAVKDKGVDTIQQKMGQALILAARIAQVPAPPAPPAPDPSR